ncbi:hypothetical protein ABVT39_014445 [Epinephelus coioides]
MEQRIIVAVCGYSVLYDSTSPFYRDCNRKEMAWKKVSEEVQLPVDVCRRKWKSLWDTYLRERKKEGEKRSGSAAGQVKKWKYSAVLSFLDLFITPRETSSNMAPGVEEDGAAEESMVLEGNDRDDEAAAGPSSVETEHQDQSSDEQSDSAPPATPDPPADGPSAAARGPAAGSSSGQGRSANVGWRSRKTARESDEDRRMRIEELLIHSLERQQAPPPPPPPPPV